MAIEKGTPTRELTIELDSTNKRIELRKILWLVSRMRIGLVIHFTDPQTIKKKKGK